MIMVIIVITIKQNISHFVKLFKNFVSNLHAYTIDLYLRDPLFKTNKTKKLLTRFCDRITQKFKINYNIHKINIISEKLILQK